MSMFASSAEIDARGCGEGGECGDLPVRAESLPRLESPLISLHQWQVFHDRTLNLDSTIGGPFWSEQGPGSEPFERVGLNHNPLQVYLDAIEPAPNMPAPQLQYRDRGGLFVQQPVNAPTPPVPLPGSFQTDAHGSTLNDGPAWNAGFVAGCRFASQISGGPSIISQLRPNLTQSLTQ
ncbi:hypothetical protein FRC11_007592, partial [Ceratobasidium sp. 423]